MMLKGVKIKWLMVQMLYRESPQTVIWNRNQEKGTVKGQFICHSLNGYTANCTTKHTEI